MTTVPRPVEAIRPGDIIRNDLGDQYKVLDVRDCPGGFSCLRSSRRDEPCRILDLGGFGEEHHRVGDEVDVVDTSTNEPPVGDPAQDPPRQGIPDVYMSTRRRGLDAHRLADNNPSAIITACGRSTRTGIVLSATEARDRWRAGWCERCWPDGSPLDQASDGSRTGALLAAGVATVYEDEPAAPTKRAAGQESGESHPAHARWTGHSYVCRRCGEAVWYPEDGSGWKHGTWPEATATADPHPVLLATATWTPLRGDPAASERGRWVVDRPGHGHTGLIEGPGRTSLVEVGQLLREGLEDEGIPVGDIVIDTVDVVTAYAPAIVSTRNGRIAARLRELAGIVERAPDDLPEPSLLFFFGSTTLPGKESERIEARVRATAEVLGMPEPKVEIKSHTCPFRSEIAGAVTVGVSGYIAPPPTVCPSCGQTCTHGEQA